MKNSEAGLSVNWTKLPEFEEGDIVFRRGVSVESYAVMVASQNRRYSHVGIAHKNELGKWGVVHIEPGNSKKENSIRFEPLNIFWAKNRASKGGIYRTKLDREQKLQLKNYIERMYACHVEFDDGYDLFDTNKIYCTELLYHAYNAADIDLTNGELDTLLFPEKKPIIFPATILKAKDLQTIFLYNSN